MKTRYTKTKLPLYVLSLLMATTLVSCGTTQTVSGSNDGIYEDNAEEPRRRIIQTTDRDYDEYENNYFTKELQRLDELNGTDIITDIEDYRSEEYDFDEPAESESSSTQIIVNNEPWGYTSDSDVVIRVNTFGGNQWGMFDPFWDPFWNPYWRGSWGFGWNRWGPNPYWNNGLVGFYNTGYYPLFFRHHYNPRYAYGRYGYHNNRYYRNNRRGYRTNRGVAYNNSRRQFRRNNSRINSRRSSSYNRRNRSSSRTNRYSSDNRRRRASSTKRSGSRDRVYKRSVSPNRRGSYSNGSNNKSRRKISRSSGNRSRQANRTRTSRSRNYSSNRSSRSRSYSRGRSSSSSRGSSSRRSSSGRRN